MLGKTHIPAGITAAIIMTQPADVPELACAVSGGAIGGWICDIDCLNSSRKEGAVFGGILAAVLTCAALWFDSTHGGSLIQYFNDSAGKKMLTGAAVMLICCIFGYISSHRTFTHSALGLILMSQAATLVCPPIGAAFTAGAASHILLDIFNKKDVMLLYPLRKGFSLGVCSSDGAVNHVLTAVFTASSAGLIALCSHNILHNGVKAAVESGLFSDIMPQTGSFLMFVNVAVLLVSVADILMRKTHISRSRGDDTRTFSLALCALGGGAGMVISAIVLAISGKRHKLGWFLTGLFSAAFWANVYIITEDPFETIVNSEMLLPILTWLGLVNILAAVAGFFSRKAKVRKLCRIAGYAGGGVGVLLGLAVSGKRVSDRELPLMPLIVSSVEAAVGVLLLSI